MTDKQKYWLQWLKDRGGSGYVDRYGRVVAGGDMSPQGACVTWLKLTSAGLVIGGGNRIRVVE